MSWFRKRRAKPEPTPTDRLLAALDAAGSDGRQWAQQIRVEGQPAIERLLRQAAEAAIRTPAFLRLVPAFRAAAEWDREVNGHDWSRIPEQPIRDLVAEQRRAEIIARANGRRAAALRKINERQMNANLGFVRGQKGF